MNQQIHLPSPCPQNPRNFTPTGKGGFCQSCQKEVVDFRKMSQNEIIDFFKNNSSNRCGIFYPSQLESAKESFGKVKFNGFWVLSFVGFLGLTFPVFTQTLSNPRLEQSPSGSSEISKPDSYPDPSRKIQGRIISETEKDGIPGALILIKGNKVGTSTNLDGFFELEIPDSISSKKITLVLSFIGYQIMEIPLDQSQLPFQLGEIILKEDINTLMGEVIIIQKPNFWQKVKGLFRSEKTQNCSNPKHQHA
jgi:hypothetical protein